jgi:DNA mismatch repair protein MutS
MSMINEYIEYQQNYEKLYGENTIVLYQNGSFFEIFGLDNDTEKIGCPKEISEILNIILTRKNKIIRENTRKNPLMCGFQKDSIDKYLQILLNNNYTVVLVEQVTNPPNPKREVTKIFSPGTYMEESLGQIDSNYLVSIFIENLKDDKLAIGLSSVELTTGKCIVYETYSTADDLTRPLDETFRFLQSYNPREVIVYNSSNKSQNYYIDFFELYHVPVQYRDLENSEKNIKLVSKITYQEKFLEKVYTNNTILSPIEYIDLEKNHFALKAFIGCLQFAFEHNETIINKIEKPQIWKESEQLVLDYNAICQLNIIENFELKTLNKKRRYHSLFSVIKNTSTALGHRLLKQKLLEPIYDSEKLRLSYNQIESMINKSDMDDGDGIIFYETFLKQITDLERLHRKIHLQKIQPYEFSTLINSYNVVTQLIDNEKSQKDLMKILPSEQDLKKFRKYLKKIKSYFNMEELDGTNLTVPITNNIFKPGAFKEIDELSEKIKESLESFQKLQTKFSSILNIKDSIKLIKNAKEGYYLTTTAKRFDTLKKRLKKEDKYKDLIVKTHNKFRTFEMDKTCDELDELMSQFNSETKICFSKILIEFSDEYSDIFIIISTFVATLDLIKSNAKTAIQNGYCKPKILKDRGNGSKLKSKALRHPLGEKLISSEEYVPNDVLLDNDESGLLIYGINSSGKSNLMKAVGCNLIMAQAGMYVACKSFKFIPFERIMTRIRGEDNIFKGQSSFAVEMAELRSILKRANNKTLVLGDEICHGTEQISAQAIVAESIINLSSKDVKFIFATHLHSLSDMKIIRDLKNVKHCHFQVTYDNKEKKIIYNRILAPGNGSSIYGIEVAEAMGLDLDFIKKAKEIRRSIIDSNSNSSELSRVISDNCSRYNSDYFLEALCEFCNEVKATDVHHIKFQGTSDKNNLIDKRFHKNKKHNLVSLCKVCHQNIHKDLFKINGYKMTSKGYELIKEIS